MNFLDKILSSKTEEEDKIIWSTDLVNKAKSALEEGYELNTTPFYEKDLNYKKSNMLYDFTDEEIKEYEKCAKDVVYFANNYAYTMSDLGVKQIKLREYQEEILKAFQENRFCCLKASRQIGKTICSSIFIVHYILFNFERNVLIMANKGETTKELMDKIRTIIENLPFFLKPGMIKKDVMGMKFDSGCRILGQTTTKSAAIGFTVHLLYCDEFAHIPHNIIEPFWRSVYPTLSSSKISRCIITSTPNGFNKFYDIFSKGELKQNEFVSMNIPWWRVPGRDDAWKERETNNLGSSELFNQEYECLFLSSSNLLLSSYGLKKISDNKISFVWKKLENLENSEGLFEVIDYINLKWHPDFDIELLKDDSEFFVWSVDTSEGVGGDSSVLSIFQLKLMEKKEVKKIKNVDSLTALIKLSQVGTFELNTIAPDKFAKLIYHICLDVHNSENLKLVIEANTFGGEVIRWLQGLYGDDNEFEPELIVRFFHRQAAKNKELGIKLGNEKTIYCNDTKRLIDSGYIEIFDELHVKEFESFARNKTGSYEALTGHDDRVMTIVNLSQFFKTLDCSEMLEEFLSWKEEEIEELEEVLDAKLRKSEKSEEDEYDFLFQ